MVEPVLSVVPQPALEAFAVAGELLEPSLGGGFELGGQNEPGHAGNFRIGKAGDEPRQPIGIEGHVIVGEGNDLSGGCVRSAIPRVGQAGPGLGDVADPLLVAVARLELGRHAGCGRPVVDHDHVEEQISLGEGVADGGQQPTPKTTASRDHDRGRRPRRAQLIAPGTRRLDLVRQPNLVQTRRFRQPIGDAMPADSGRKLCPYGIGQRGVAEFVGSERQARSRQPAGRAASRRHATRRSGRCARHREEAPRAGGTTRHRSARRLRAFPTWAWSESRGRGRHRSGAQRASPAHPSPNFRSELLATSRYRCSCASEPSRYLRGGGGGAHREASQ